MVNLRHTGMMVGVSVCWLLLFSCSPQVPTVLSPLGGNTYLWNTAAGQRCHTDYSSPPSACVLRAEATPSRTQRYSCKSCMFAKKTCWPQVSWHWYFYKRVLRCSVQKMFEELERGIKKGNVCIHYNTIAYFLTVRKKKITSVSQHSALHWHISTCPFVSM